MPGPNMTMPGGVPATGALPVVRSFEVPLAQALPGQQVYVMSGVTYDENGVALGGCVVKLFRTSDDLEQYVTLSDANGNYSFNLNNPTTQWYAVGYKAGSPDLAGTTRNDLIPT